MFLAPVLSVDVFCVHAKPAKDRDLDVNGRAHHPIKKLKEELPNERHHNDKNAQAVH
jgi:hypothetical protein